MSFLKRLGDFAVKRVGVIPEPEINQYKLEDNDRFLILASDGVWEFIEPQEAVEIVHLNLHKGAETACTILIETASERWAEEEGDYRDDVRITANVALFLRSVLLKFSV
jgi:serine/threonine protein phosphatase PrpC